MLDQLDTLIGFAVIVTIVSLLVTIVVQMISAALALRGKKLAAALHTTLKTVVPGIDARMEELTEFVLSRPHLSDSTLATSAVPGSVTVPGANAVPNANAVEKYQRANDAAQRLASAIRPEEFFKGLQQIVSGQVAASEEIKDTAKQLLTKLGAPTETLAALQNTAANLARAINALPADFDPGLKHVLANAQQKYTTLVAAGDEAVQKSLASAKAEFEKWFNAAQDRAQQHFLLSTRKWTIGIGFAFALFCQLDAIEIYQRVDQDSALREKLLAQAAVINEQAGAVLKDSPDILRRAFDSWKPKQSSEDQGKLNPAKLDFTSNATLRDSVAASLACGASDPRIESLLTTIAETATAQLSDGSQRYTKLNEALANAGFELFPKGGWRWKAASETNAPAGKAESQEEKKGLCVVLNDLRPRLLEVLGHLHGILAFAALLTLGAPFWFNILRSLTNLRTVLAQNIHKEDAAANDARGRP